MSDKSDIQLFADKYPSPDSVHLAIMDIARLSHAGKHGQRVKELLGKLVAVECTAPAPQPCESCAGSGYFTVTYEMAADAGQPDRYGAQEECRTCGGSGRAATPQVTPAPTSIASGMVWYQDNVLKQTHKFPEAACTCSCHTEKERCEQCCDYRSTSEQAPQELELEQEADGRWLAAYTRFPGVAAYGPSREEAIRNAAKVLIEVTAEVPPAPDRCPKCNSADRSGHITAWAGLEPVYCQDSFHSSAGTPKGTK